MWQLQGGGGAQVGDALHIAGHAFANRANETGIEQGHPERIFQPRHQALLLRSGVPPSGRASEGRRVSVVEQSYPAKLRWHDCQCVFQHEAGYERTNMIAGPLSFRINRF